MSEKAIQNFLEQFATSKKNVSDWPNWMQESAKIATASFPKQHHAEVKEDKTREVASSD